MLVSGAYIHIWSSSQVVFWCGFTCFFYFEIVYQRLWCYCGYQLMIKIMSVSDLVGQGTHYWIHYGFWGSATHFSGTWTWQHLSLNLSDDFLRTVWFVSIYWFYDFRLCSKSLLALAVLLWTAGEISWVSFTSSGLCKLLWCGGFPRKMWFGCLV